MIMGLENQNIEAEQQGPSWARNSWPLNIDDDLTSALDPTQMAVAVKEAAKAAGKPVAALTFSGSGAVGDGTGGTYPKEPPTPGLWVGVILPRPRPPTHQMLRSGDFSPAFFIDRGPRGREPWRRLNGPTPGRSTRRLSDS